MIGAILIYIVTSGTQVVTHSQEFSDVASCQRAIAALVEMEEGQRFKVKARCLVK
jgi:hypothetical protein